MPENLFTVSLPSIERLLLFHFSGFQASCHNICIWVSISNKPLQWDRFYSSHLRQDISRHINYSWGFKTSVLYVLFHICVLHVQPLLSPWLDHPNNVGYEILAAVVIKSSVFWVITPCSPPKINQCFRGTCRLHLQWWRRSQLRKQHEARSSSSVLKTQVTCSETSVDLQRTTRHSIPEYRTCLQCSVKTTYRQVLSLCSSTSWFHFGRLYLKRSRLV
jgi:hypothetical protein